MKQMTQQHLINAFGGESQAHMRYLHFAKHAEREKFPNVARLLQAAAHAEYVHAGNHFRVLKHLEEEFVANSGTTFGPGKTRKNLALAVAGETFEVNEMYPVYIQAAVFQGETTAARSFEWAFAAEKQHKRLFERALRAVKANRDVKLRAIQVCDVCGCTVEGDAPARCPVCEAAQNRFVSFD